MSAVQKFKFSNILGIICLFHNHSTSSSPSFNFLVKVSLRVPNRVNNLYLFISSSRQGGSKASLENLFASSVPRAFDKSGVLECGGRCIDLVKKHMLGGLYQKRLPSGGMVHAPWLPLGVLLLANHAVASYRNAGKLTHRF